MIESRAQTITFTINNHDLPDVERMDQLLALSQTP